MGLYSHVRPGTFDRHLRTKALILAYMNALAAGDIDTPIVL